MIFRGTVKTLGGTIARMILSADDISAASALYVPSARSLRGARHWNFSTNHQSPLRFYQARRFFLSVALPTRSLPFAAQPKIIEARRLGIGRFRKRFSIARARVCVYVYTLGRAPAHVAAHRQHLYSSTILLYGSVHSFVGCIID